MTRHAGCLLITFSPIKFIKVSKNFLMINISLIVKHRIQSKVYKFYATENLPKRQSTNPFDL